MEPILATIATLALVAAFLLFRSLRQGRTIDAIRRATGGDIDPRDLPAWIEGLRKHRERGRPEATSAEPGPETETVLDLAGVGLLLVAGSGRIASANASAHALLDRAPGSLVGRTPIEAFVDRRI
ncbi:MAG TPA: hypothetical protein VM344_02200, partial [Vitreimonas sp.]|nr:hypothetical protein [Vitreimonas sp.]